MICCLQWSRQQTEGRLARYNSDLAIWVKVDGQWPGTEAKNGSRVYVFMFSNNRLAVYHMLQCSCILGRISRDLYSIWWEQLCLSQKCIWVFYIYFSDWDDIRPSSALEVISEEEAVQIIAEPLLPIQSSTLRDYVDHSETLAKLVHLGMCDVVCVVSLCQKLCRSCNLCFALTGYLVNLKMGTVTNGKKLQNVI